jgi:hypothetical protein
VHDFKQGSTQNKQGSKVSGQVKNKIPVVPLMPVIIDKCQGKENEKQGCNPENEQPAGTRPVLHFKQGSGKNQPHRNNSVDIMDLLHGVTFLIQ